MTSMTRDEYAGAPAREAARAERIARQGRDLKLVAQAAVSAQDLTGHPAWDRYLSHIQGAIEATERVRAGFVAALSDPANVEHAALLRCKLGIERCEGRIEAFAAMRALPRDIMEQGEAARDLLSRLPEIAET